MKTQVVETLPQLFLKIVDQFPEAPAQLHKNSAGDFVPTSWSELASEVNLAACALAEAGVRRGDTVGLIAENRKEWLIADLATLGLGAVDVPRGNDSTTQELAFILSAVNCRVAFAEGPNQARQILSVYEQLPKLEMIILLDPMATADADWSEGCVSVRTWVEFLATGNARAQADAHFYREQSLPGRTRDLATIIFTSGTTGEPKGVMLCHGNFLHQVDHVPDLLDVDNSDIWLCVLPVWHSFERVMQYVAMGRGSALAYSKPIGKVLMTDLKAVRPTWMASVPRIWEAVMDGIRKNIKSRPAPVRAVFQLFLAIAGLWAASRNLVWGRVPRFTRRVRWLDSLIGLLPWLILTPLKLLGDALVFGEIKARLGGRFVAGISGGGALPVEVDRFFEAAGVLLLEGYGITETAPVLGVRSHHHPVPGTVGPVFPGTEARIIGETGEILPPGQKGVIHVRGPQVMLGYYNRPDLTAQVLTADGWFNTGDLGVLTWDNELKIVGRAKDTIVLLGGENIEPLPIEQKLCESPYIEAAVVVGQDQKLLGALIVPRQEAVEDWVKNNGSTALELFQAEVSRLVSLQTGFKAFERIGPIGLLPKAFEIGLELSAKQEIRRHYIQDHYRAEIAALFR